MEIEIHGFVAVVHNISVEGIQKLTNEILHINYNLYAKNEFENKLTLKYALGGKGESVSICSSSILINDEFTYIKLNLHGSFFDNSPDFDLAELILFISQFKYTLKQLDVAFNDNKQCLTVDEIERWCNIPQDYCVGNLVRRDAPGVRRKNSKFDRIELGSAGSTASYGTIYVRPDTGFIRFEIKFRKSHQIQYLIEEYNIYNYQQFEKRSMEALVGCINFIRPSSRGKRNKAKDIKQLSWKLFLESDINKINWEKLKREKNINRFVADNYSSDKSIKRLASMFQNLVRKASIIISEDEVLNQFSKYSGYIVRKNKTV